MMQYGFSFDISRCTGCMACVIACQDQNDSEGDNPPSFRYVIKYEKVQGTNPLIYFFSISCQHCGDAPCIMVCPVRAIKKRDEDGVVVIDRDLCIGCHSCEMACPFGAPKFQGDGRMAKCDLCYTRIEKNMKPACVRICPTGALGAGPIEELSKKKAEKASFVFLTSLVGDYHR
ncbi:MAG: 4Fe-4S binding protein [Syntrophorhabdaceae bacterium]|nr:4Fe-4S binding protein [Syntrophorhabdaceae bacterium]